MWNLGSFQCDLLKYWLIRDRTLKEYFIAIWRRFKVIEKKAKAPFWKRSSVYFRGRINHSSCLKYHVVGAWKQILNCFFLRNEKSSNTWTGFKTCACVLCVSCEVRHAGSTSSRKVGASWPQPISVIPRLQVDLLFYSSTCFGWPRALVLKVHRVKPFLILSGRRRKFKYCSAVWLEYVKEIFPPRGLIAFGTMSPRICHAYIIPTANGLFLKNR